MKLATKEQQLQQEVRRGSSDFSPLEYAAVRWCVYKRQLEHKKEEEEEEAKEEEKTKDEVLVLLHHVPHGPLYLESKEYMLLLFRETSSGIFRIQHSSLSHSGYMGRSQSIRLFGRISHVARLHGCLRIPQCLVRLGYMQFGTLHPVSSGKYTCTPVAAYCDVVHSPWLYHHCPTVVTSCSSSADFPDSAEMSMSCGGVFLLMMLTILRLPLHYQLLPVPSRCWVFWMSCGGESFSPFGAYDFAWDSVKPKRKYTINYIEYPCRRWVCLHANDWISCNDGFANL